MRREGAGNISAIVIGAGVILGLVAFEVVSSFVGNLLAPFIALFIGDSRFELNAFTIGATEFRYGLFLEAVFVALIVAVLLSWLLPDLWRGLRKSNQQQKCPECASQVSAEAKRCPYCTSPLEGRISV